MITICAPIFHVPGLEEAIKERKALFRIFYTPTLKSEARMPENEALSLAAECRRRGMHAEVVVNG